MSSAAEAYVGGFDELNATEAPSALQSLRRAAFEQFAAMGFPTTKNEDWHFTSVSPIAEQEFTLLATATGDVRREELAPFLLGTSAHVMTFVNGRFDAALSDLSALPEGVTLRDLASAWTSAPGLTARVGKQTGYQNAAFTALNTAFMTDGAVLEIAKDVDVERPIHLLFVTDATAAKGMMHPRNLIVVGRNAKATVMESYVSLSDAMYLTNHVTEISIADGATLRHHKMQREAARAFHVGTVEVAQAKDSHYVSFSLTTGGRLTRSNIYTTLDGEGSGATLNGLVMLGADQHADVQTQIIHAQPNCYSRELYKYVLDESSHGVFNGKVYVHPVAQKTDGKQTNKTLLLSEAAHMDSKPQLEIFADDVKCTHGATIGQIDETALFYLKSRGISNTLARQLLTYAFAAEVIETIDLDPIRESLERLALERFV
jgi:Fe-S cluster assembly protein SufD